MPSVSVIMATYNHAPFLGSAIDSILGQTLSDFEFIIVNDASTDETSTILENYHDLRIVRLDNKSRLGLSASLNRALEVAQGNYVARMDSDDISTSDRLEKQVAFMDRHPEIGILGTQYEVVNRASEIVYRSTHPLTHGLIAWHYLSRHAYPLRHGTIMVRRQVFERYGGYNTDFPREQDGELFLRLIHTVKYANLPEVLYLVRASRSSETASKVFATHFPLTLEIRRRCVAQLLDRDVTIEEMQAVIFPQKRAHRKACGVRLTLSSIQRGVSLLFEILQALDKKGYLDSAERQQAADELGHLIANMFDQSEEFFLHAARTKSLPVLVQPLIRRLAYRLAHREILTAIKYKFQQR